MATFAEKAPSIVATAAELARLRGERLEEAVLKQARPSLVQTGYDNLDGGTDLYTLMLEVPVALFASVEDRQDEVEKSIHQHVRPLVRIDAGNVITEVVISPILAAASRPVEEPASGGVAEEELPDFWDPGYFRLFLSHLAMKRDVAHRLKEALAAYRIAAFVAHDDIEPTREWQAEIERALRTMDALAALVTEGFVDSKWCDQEVGIAIGRGKLVVPVRLGADPHGFMSKYQGLSARGLDHDALAERIVDTLLKNSSSEERMADALVDKLAASGSFAEAKHASILLAKVARLNTAQVGRLLRAVDDNSQVRGAFGVPDRVRAIVRRLSEVEPA